MKIVLIGYMGSGKSTVGKELAKDRNLDFLDLDSYIEDKEGLTVSEIFTVHGELYFRKKESEYLKEILTKNDDFVLATGGGTPCYGFNMKEILTSTENVFYLNLSLALLVDRLAQEKAKRPLIVNVDETKLVEFIGKHLFERSFFYHQAKTSIAIDNKTPKQIVKNITEKLV